MTWHLSAYLLPYLVAALVTASLVGLLWPRRQEPGAAPLMLLMAAACLWSVANGLEVAAVSLPDKLFWARVQYGAKVAIPVLWLATALHYAGRGEWLTRGRLAVFSLVPAATLAITWTTERHGWMLSDFAIDASGPVALVTKAYGPWFWISIGYSYGVIAFATLTILFALLGEPRIYRGQATVWLIAAAVPLAGNASYIVGIDLFRGLDLSPAAFAVSGVVLYWGFRRFLLFDLVPAARESMVEAMSEGVLVLDSHRRIVDLNPAAQRILGLEPEAAMGRAVAEVAPSVAQRLPHGHSCDQAITEVELAGERGLRTYELRLSSLRGSHGSRRGLLVLLLDVTESRRLQRELHARSLVDELTGLYNRRGFFQIAEQQRQLAVRRRSPALLVFADLDGLKEVNDRQGHAAGDELLNRAALTLRQAFRDTDVIARLGGDELAVFALDVEPRQVPVFAARLAGSGGPDGSPGSDSVALSVGFASLDPGAPASLEALLKQADREMYREKERRRRASNTLR